MNSPTEHRYAAASDLVFQRVDLKSSDVTLRVAQQPLIARVAIGKEKDRKPIDPPPVVKLSISSRADPLHRYIQSPYFFMTCTLKSPDDKRTPAGNLGTSLVGSLVSSIHKLKDDTKIKGNRDDDSSNNSKNDNNDGAYFVFGDVSVKVEGWYTLQFSLFELRNHEQKCTYLQSIFSEPFQVYSVKTWPGMYESTPLTRAFGDQGVKLRIRKEPRTLLKKRGPASDNYEPRRYRRNRIGQQADQEPDEDLDNLRASQRDSYQSPTHRQDSIDQSYTQTQDLPSHGYSPETTDYNENNQYDNPPPKRPRTSSMHSSSDSFSQNASITRPQIATHNTYTELQQLPFNYGQPTNQQAQGGFYDSSALMTPLQSTNSVRDEYSSRAQVNTGFSSAYGSHSQRSLMIHQQNNSRFAQLQYNIPGHSTHAENLGYQPRSELVGENVDVYSYQSRPQMMALPGLMAPPSTGRVDNTTLGGYGNFGSIPMRMPYQPGLSQNQNLSRGIVAGGTLASNQTPISTSTSAPPTLDSSFS